MLGGRGIIDGASEYSHDGCPNTLQQKVSFEYYDGDYSSAMVLQAAWNFMEGISITRWQSKYWSSGATACIRRYQNAQAWVLLDVAEY